MNEAWCQANLSNHCTCQALTQESDALEPIASITKTHLYLSPNKSLLASNPPDTMLIRTDNAIIGPEELRTTTRALFFRARKAGMWKPQQQKIRWVVKRYISITFDRIKAI